MSTRKSLSKTDRLPVPIRKIESKIHLIRGQRVLLDRDLATLYGVKAIALRQQVKRNLERFPADFMFQLTGEETELLLSQNVIPSRRSLGGALPYVFTQEGVAMLSSVLKSKRAVTVNVAIMRVFVRLREVMSAHKDLALKLQALEQKLERHDGEIQAIFQAIKELLESPPSESKRPIGFRSE